MIFTPRFFWLFSLGFLLALLGGFVPSLAPAVFLYDALLLALAVGDYRTVAPAGEWEIERRCSPVLSLGVPHAVRLRLRNRSGRVLRLRVRDAPPPSLRPEGSLRDVRLAGNTEASYEYTIRPGARGDFRFGDLVCRVSGPLGLARAQVVVPAAQEVRVYPPLQQLSQVELALAHAASGRVGLKPARLLGEGTEFESLRDYVSDDDYRWIDWKATAKRSHLVSRDYQSERNQRLVIAIDTGRLMGARVGAFTKLDFAVNAALLLAQVALAKGDLAGLVLFADRVAAALAPDKGRAHLGRILEALQAAQPVRFETDYAGACAHLARRNSRRSLMVIFTDLVDAEASRPLIAGLRRLAPRHLPLCVTMVDADLVAAQTAVPATKAAAFELVAALELWEDRQNALRLLELQGALTVSVPAQHLATAVVNRYVEIKRRARL